MKKILIAVDNGSFTQKIAQEGLKLGKELGAEIALISVVDSTPVTVGIGVEPRELTNMIKDEYQKIQDGLINDVFADDSIPSFVEDGDVSNKILEVADSWGADVIVAGTHGRTGLLDVLMGSIAKDLIKHSKKPIFLVPAR